MTVDVKVAVVVVLSSFGRNREQDVALTLCRHLYWPPEVWDLEMLQGECARTTSYLQVQCLACTTIWMYTAAHDSPARLHVNGKHLSPQPVLQLMSLWLSWLSSPSRCRCLPQLCSRSPHTGPAPTRIFANVHGIPSKPRARAHT